MSRSLGGATAPTQDRISSNGDSPPSSRSAPWSKEIVIATVLCVLSALVIGAPKVGVLWGLSDETALVAHGDSAVPDHLTSKIGWCEHKEEPEGQLPLFILPCANCLCIAG